MKTTNYLPEVRQQYEDYPFPPVEARDESWRLQVMPQDLLENINHYCFGGRRDFRKDFRVLVAGGGTGHAVVFLAEQLRDTNAEIYYVDLSHASRAVAQERAEIRGLTNINWVSGSLLDVPTMGIGQFDYINCTGVLHHLENPTAGLMALKSVLKEDGAMGLMVYGKYGRASYYHVQEMMRLINDPSEHPEQKIENTKAAMSSLPETFFLGHGIHRQKHLDGFFNDHINLYDTFLHSQDRAYTVEELYEWLDTCGLEMNGFTNFNASMSEKILYRPELYIKDDKLLDKVMDFPLRRRQAVAELVSSQIGLHTFYCSYRSDAQAVPDDFSMVPFFSDCHCGGEPVFTRLNPVETCEWMESNPGQQFVLRHPMGLTIAIPNTPCTGRIIRYIDGERSLETIFQMVAADMESMTATPLAKYDFLSSFMGIYNVCSELEWLRLRHESVPAYPTYQEMQSRVTSQYAAKDHVA